MLYRFKMARQYDKYDPEATAATADRPHWWNCVHTQGNIDDAAHTAALWDFRRNPSDPTTASRHLISRHLIIGTMIEGDPIEDYWIPPDRILPRVITEYNERLDAVKLRQHSLLPSSVDQFVKVREDHLVLWESNGIGHMIPPSVEPDALALVIKEALATWPGWYAGNYGG